MKGDHSLFVVVLSRRIETLDGAPKSPVRYRCSIIILYFSSETSNMKTYRLPVFYPAAGSSFGKEVPTQGRDFF
jgi:hypothetical protein